MSKVEDLLERYKTEHRNSESADPRPYLEQVSGLERAELRAHIDHFLASARSPAFDAAAFARFRSDAKRQQLVSRVLDDATLHDLVKNSGIKRVELGRRLAQRLGLPGHDARVRGRLRDIENGDVDLDRVRPSLWEAISDVVGEPADRIRHAAENALRRPETTHTEPSFARSAPTVSRASVPEAPDTDDADEQRLVDEAFFVD